MIAIRQARLPDDRPAFIAFIKGLQEYEVAFEKNRRLDDTYAEESLAVLLEAAENGMIFVAEDEDRPIGWAVVFEEDAPVFVREDERRFAYISELFVEEARRGQGVGQALIAACEDWARAHGYSTIRIAHLAANTHAGQMYDKAGYAPYSMQRRKRL